MGGASISKFETTDWETADGEGLLKTTSSCISGTTTLPTSEKMTVTFSKTSAVSQRDYTIKNKDTGSILYKTFEIVGTTKWFDLLLPADNNDSDDNKNGEGTKVCRVQTDETHKYWDIFRYGNNQFDGQKEEETGDANNHLFKSCRVTLGNASFFDGSNSSNMHVNFYKNNPKDKTGILGENYLKVEKVKGEEEAYQTTLYHKATTTNGKNKTNDLVSFWKFEKSDDTADDKKVVSTLHIAKSSDLALHIILVVITHMIHVERSVKEDM